jgi:hypothetical protein
MLSKRIKYVEELEELFFLDFVCLCVVRQFSFRGSIVGLS